MAIYLFLSSCYYTNRNEIDKKLTKFLVNILEDKEMTVVTTILAVVVVGAIVKAEVEKFVNVAAALAM